LYLVCCRSTSYIQDGGNNHLVDIQGTTYKWHERIVHDKLIYRHENGNYTITSSRIQSKQILQVEYRGE
jgi:hypothetical protein